MSLPVLLALPADARGALARPASASVVTPGAQLFADAVRELAPAETEKSTDAAPEDVLVAIDAATLAAEAPVGVPGPLSLSKGPTPVEATPELPGTSGSLSLSKPTTETPAATSGSLSLSKGPAPVEATPELPETSGSLSLSKGPTAEAPAAILGSLSPSKGPTAEAPAAILGSLSLSKGPTAVDTTPFRQAQGATAERPAESGPLSPSKGPTTEAPTAVPGPVTLAKGPAPVDAAAPASAPRPALLPQLSGPVVSLARAGDGAHSITLTISPEALGPVTVHARISDGSIRLELHAPSDAGREALKVILADLRRDLAAAAPHATLSVSSQDAPSSSASGSSGSSGSFAGSSHGRPGSDPTAPRQPDHPAHPAGRESVPRPPAPAPSPHGGIDVYA